MLCESIISATFLIGSTHVPTTEDTYKYNNFNPGIILECSDHIVFGAYYNSFKKVTAIAGYKLSWEPAQDFELGAVIAACTGYKYPVCIAGTISYQHIFLAVVPKITDIQNTTVYTAGLKWRF